MQINARYLWILDPQLTLYSLSSTLTWNFDSFHAAHSPHRNPPSSLSFSSVGRKQQHVVASGDEEKQQSKWRKIPIRIFISLRKVSLKIVSIPVFLNCSGSFLFSFFFFLQKPSEHKYEKTFREFFMHSSRVSWVLHTINAFETGKMVQTIEVDAALKRLNGWNFRSIFLHLLFLRSSAIEQRLTENYTLLNRKQITESAKK